MSWTPISGAPIQLQKSDGTLASGYYIKFYVAGTTTPLSMATDSTGGTTLAKAQINTAGYPVNGSGDVFIPHVSQSYKIVLYKSATDADNDTTGNADWVVDNITQSAAATPTQTIEIEKKLGSDAVGQVFTLTSIVYTLGVNNLAVYRNGIRLIQGVSNDYEETSATSITVNSNITIADSDNWLFVIGESTTSTVSDAASVTYTPAGSGAVATNVQDKIRQYAQTPQDFGAAGDGVTDDSNSLDSLLTLSSAKESHLNAYTFAVTDTIDLDNSFVNAAQGASLKWTGSAGGTLSEARSQHFEVESLWINGNSSAAVGIACGPTAALGRNSSFWSRLVDCRIENFTSYGLDNKGSGAGAGREAVDLRISRTWFRSNGIGARLRQPDHYIEGCVFSSNTTYALEFEDNTKYNIYGCIFSDNGTHIRLSSSLGGKGVVSGCWFENGVIFSSVASLTLNGTLRFEQCHMASPLNTNPVYSLDMDNIIRGNVVLDSCTFPNALTQDSINIGGITQANPAVVTASGHGRSNGELVFITGVSGMTEVNNRIFVVQNATTNTFEISERSGATDDTSFFATSNSAGSAVNSSGYGAYSNGGTVTLAQTFRLPRCPVSLLNCFARLPNGNPIAMPVTGERGDLANLTMLNNTDVTDSISIFGGELVNSVGNDCRVKFDEFGSHSLQMNISKFGFNPVFKVTVADADTIQMDDTTTAGQTRLLVYDVDNATLERVTVGAADSGGPGFKVLRIPN